MRCGIFRPVLGVLLVCFSIEAFGLPSFRCYSRIGRSFNEFNINDTTPKIDYAAAGGTTSCEINADGFFCSAFSELTGQRAEQSIDLGSSSLDVSIDKRAIGTSRTDAGVACYNGNATFNSKVMSCVVTQNGRYVGTFSKRNDPIETATQLLLPNGSYLSCFQNTCGVTRRDPTSSGVPWFSLGNQNHSHMIVKSGLDVTNIQCDATQLDQPVTAVQTNPITTDRQEIPLKMLDFANLDARVDGDILVVQGSGRNAYNLKTGEVVRSGPYVANDDIYLGEKDGASYVLKVETSFGSDLRKIRLESFLFKENRIVYGPYITSNLDPSRSLKAVLGGDNIFIWTETGGFLVSAKTGESIPLPAYASLMGRHASTVVYANDGFVVWGGFNGAKEPLNTGASFSTITKTWTSMSAANAPSARGGAYGFWNGKNLIIYGGFIGEAMPQSVRASAFYDFIQQSWTAINLVGSPAKSGVGDLAFNSFQKCSSNKSVRFDGRYISELVFELPSQNSNMYLFDTIENKWLQTKILPTPVGLSRAFTCQIYDIPGFVVADPHFASVVFSNIGGVNKPTLFRTPLGQ